jgi:rhamnogalacturonyl hydrolase YesR
MRTTPLAILVLAGMAACFDNAAPSSDVVPDLAVDSQETASPDADLGVDYLDIPQVDQADEADVAPETIPADTLTDAETLIDTISDPGPLPAWPDRPALVTRPDRKAAILARLDQEPWAGILAGIRNSAAQACADDTGSEWGSGVFGRNGQIAQAAATVAWLFDDAAAAATAIDCFSRIRTDWETNTVWDMNISMADGQITYAVAWDLMAGTTMFPETDAAEARRRMLEINQKFYERYVLDDFQRWSALTVSQNNHPIRTTSSMGFVALAFPDQPGSREILDFAASELAYLWGPTGRYIGDDGVVSEEPFYFGFGFPPALAFFLAMRTAWPADALLFRNCINRNNVDPWAPIDCLDGQPFEWEDPLAAPGSNPHADRFWAAFDWSLDHRMPSGLRSAVGDGKMRVQNAGLLLTALSGRGRYAWDSRHNEHGDLSMTRGLNLSVQHLFEVTQAPTDVQPFWSSTAHMTSGHAVLRSGWGPDDLWIVLLGESGAARKTLHDHADGTSFAMSAYGEHLLMDTGYFKPIELNNAVTADAPSHSLVLIDGQAAPKRGLLNDWGDADASIDLFHDGQALDLAVASQSYQQATIHRSMLMVRNRYALVADRIESLVNGPREFAWRVHGYAGYDSGGTYSVDSTGATFVKQKAGIRVSIGSTVGAPTVAEPPYVDGQAPHSHSIASESGHGSHAVADATINAVAPSFLAVLAPYQVAAADGTRDAPLTVTRIASSGGSAAWTITGTHGTDLAWMRDPSGPDTLEVNGRTVHSDAGFVLLALDGSLAYLDGGQLLQLDGADVPMPVAIGPSTRVLDTPFDACVPGMVPDNACFAARRYPASEGIALATAMAHRQMTRVAADKLVWDWEPAVMMTAFCELHRVTGDPELLAYVKTWLDHHIEAGYTMMSSDTASPVAATLYVHQLTPDPKYRGVIERFRTYIRDEALRTEDGGINHLGTLEIMGITLWVDSLWMIGIPLARWGTGSSEEWALDLAAQQFQVFAKRLQEEPGFFRHADDWALPQDPGVYWGRGNGWVLAATSEYLRIRSLRGETDPQVRTALARLTAAALGFQDDASGMWWTVLNRPGETYLETSTGALFAFGMARAWRNGLLGDEVLPAIAKAMVGVRSRLVDAVDGPVVQGTSGPTSAGTFAEYSAVPQKDDILYGIGAVILSLIETSGLPAR